MRLHGRYTAGMGAVLGICVVLAGQPAAAATAAADPRGLPSLERNLVASYDFEHPVPGDPSRESDLGRSGTPLELINGGAAMRVPDGAHPGSTTSLQVQQVNPATAGNDDWKAGVYSAAGAPTLRAFNGARGISITTWVKMGEPNPSPDSNTPDPDDRYNAIGLSGLLAGGSDGHAVRALLELIEVDGTLRLVALARRVDGAASRTFAASEDWRTLLPVGEWVSLAATFDFDTGEMALYRNGRPVDGAVVQPGDPWGLEGPPEPDVTSATDPAGIKIGGSYPQNTREANPCNCRMDSLMFFDRALDRGQVIAQYQRATRVR